MDYKFTIEQFIKMLTIPLEVCGNKSMAQLLVEDKDVIIFDLNDSRANYLACKDKGDLQGQLLWKIIMNKQSRIKAMKQHRDQHEVNVGGAWD